jgi:RsiW-degrading membrane proteinase PrsW (M82 family)
MTYVSGGGAGTPDTDRSASGAPVRPTPVGTRGWTSLRLPAFWLFLLLLGIGAYRVVGLVGPAFTAYPSASIAAAVVFGLYAVPFMLVARSVDFLEREPPLLLAAALGWGGMVATTTALSGNNAVYDLLAKLVSPSFAVSWGPAISAPAIEELLKTLGVVIIVLVARKQVNSVVDGAVYGAFVGLGFQVVEDFIYAVNAVAIAGRGDRIGPVFVTLLLRGFLGGLWSHTLFSALAGAGVAYFVIRRDRPMWQRVGIAFLSWLGAWACHFVWDSPWLTDGFGYGVGGVLLAILIKGAPALIMIWLLVRAASGSEADFYLAELAGDSLIATPGEMRALRTGRRRFVARRYAYARCGRKGSNAVRLIQRAQARLAVARSRGSGDIAYWRSAVLRQRYRLISMGHGEAVVPPEHRRSWGSWVATAGLAVAVAGVLLMAINALGGS